VHEDICYKTDFLKEVVVRVDFLSPVWEVAKSLPPTISQEARRKFPIADPTPFVFEQLQVSEQGVSRSKTTGTEWRFHGMERDKTLCFHPTFLWIQYTSYDSYETLKSEFQDAMHSFLQAFKDTKVSRLGLRYINNVVLENGDPLVWSGYLNKQMLCLFKLYDESQALTRVFHNLEFNFGDHALRYQFGMHNPDYPAPIKKKTFVLDLDAYYEGLQDTDEIMNNLDKFHGRIQSLFELSITEKLRSIMRGQY
jgi:uncharacterized protein (TIGR04255 family)